MYLHVQRIPVTRTSLRLLFFYYYSLCSLFFPVGGLWPFVFSNLGYTNTISLIIRVKKKKRKGEDKRSSFSMFLYFLSTVIKLQPWSSVFEVNSMAGTQRTKLDNKTTLFFFILACCGDNPLLCEIARQCIQHYQASSAFFIYLFFVEMIMATLCKVQYSSVMLQSRRMRKDPQQAGF